MTEKQKERRERVVKLNKAKAKAMRAKGRKITSAVVHNGVVVAFGSVKK